eukprot:296087-Pleurochrysis_carterae.AAC.1
MNVTQTEDIIQTSQHKLIHLLYDHINKHYEYFNRGSADQQTYGAPNSTPVRGEQKTGKEMHIAEEKNMDNGDGQIQGEPSKTREKGEKEQEIHKEGKATQELRRRSDEGRNAIWRDTQLKQNSDGSAGTRKKLTGELQGELTLETHIGTLNISGISFGYRGKYKQTEETLLKIRPGDKLRE